MYKLAEFAISLTDQGTVWPVEEDHGRCGCGEVEMKSTVGYFSTKELAEHYCELANAGLAWGESFTAGPLENRNA